jgi:hypothetical protein
VDSFPVKPDWIEQVMEKLDQGHSLVAIRRDENLDHKPHSSFLFFPASYYQNFDPELRLSPAEILKEDYQAYSKAVPHVRDTGFGLGYNLFVNKLTWHPLTRSNQKEDHFMMGGLYGDMIFHFGAAAYETGVSHKEREGYYRMKHVVDSCIESISKVFPVAGKLQDLLFPPFKRSRFRRRTARRNERIKNEIRNKLFKDTEAYLAYLSGK